MSQQVMLTIDGVRVLNADELNANEQATVRMRKRIVLPMPRLVGPSLLLRPWCSDDAPALAAAWNDPMIRERLPVPKPADEQAARRWIGQRRRAWAEGCSADLAVVDTTSSVVTGEVGLSSFDPVRRTALVGWWTAPAWRDQGRASESVRLVLDWVLGTCLIDAVLAEVHADNPASASVARRAGLRQVKLVAVADGVSRPGLLIFARTRACG